MKKDSFYAKRLQVILNLYELERSTNNLLKVVNEIDNSFYSHKALQEYIYQSKIMRFKPYIEKMLTDIRKIHEPLQYKPQNP